MECKKATCCRDCHFLMKWDRSADGGEIKMPISVNERARLARGEPAETVVGTNYSLACFHDVWDWANRRSDSENDLVRVITLERGESCFAYPHTPGMFFPAAAELERRQADRREAQRDRRLTKTQIVVGIVVAVLCVWLGSYLQKVS